MSKTVYFVVHNFSGEAGGGVNRVVTETANEMAKNERYDVNILSLAALNGTAYPISKHVKLHSLQMKKHSTSQYKSIFKLIWLFIAFVKVFSFYRSQNKQSVWNLTSPPLIILFAIFRKYNNKLIYCEHSSPLGKKNSVLKNYFRKLILNTGYLTISLNKKDFEYYKSLNINSQLIYNGVSFPVDNKFIKEKIVIFVGRFEYEKNPIEALEIFYKSKLWEKDYKLKFFGSGQYLDKLKKESHILGINNYIEIITNENDPDKIYSKASCLIMTSKYEGLPMVLMEAMSRGIPCISYDCPQGPGEIIVDGVNGYLIQNGNKSEFIKKLSSLSCENLFPTDIVKSSQNFNINNVIHNWENIIN